MNGLLSSVPLRVKLVASLLALVALALALTGIATTTALRSYLQERTDDRLRADSGAMVDAALAGRLSRRLGGPQDDFYVRLYDVPTPGEVRDGASTQVGERLADVPREELPLDSGEPFTVRGAESGAPWRAVVVPLADGRVAFAAVPLDDVTATVARLRRIVLVVSLAVLLLLAGLAYAVVVSSLRPLREVEGTAAAIASGDLSRRVPEWDPRTEVGRLGRAFNAMVSQIEAAFHARARSEVEARASEERMRRFVADASHELRTPLTSIRGFAELYRQGAVREPDDVARILRRVEDEAARMGLLVDDLLLLARLDQQRPLEQRPVDLLAVATDAVHDARAVDPDRSIELRLAGAPPRAVLGDEARLRQVVANLVTNALHHTPAGTPVLVEVSGEPDSAVLAVSDRGPGLAPGEAARVFERFYRADASRTRPGATRAGAAGGTGLGLSIVAALVAAHGGRVEVDSEPGHGATFRVRLPLADAATERPAEVGDVPAGGAGADAAEQPADVPAPRGSGS